MAAVIPISATPSPVGAVLSLRDEAELRAYFALELPPPPGARSSFGPMCERLENARNPKTTELPTAGAAWTEIIECRLRQASNAASDAEDAYIAYIDARRRVARVHAILSRMTECEGEVLRAQYIDGAGSAESLTPTAERENRERAAGERHETVDASIENLRYEAKDMRASKANRDAARAKLGAIRRDMTERLRQARVSYARVRRSRESRTVPD